MPHRVIDTECQNAFFCAILQIKMVQWLMLLLRRYATLPHCNAAAYYSMAYSVDPFLSLELADWPLRGHSDTRAWPFLGHTPRA